MNKKLISVAVAAAFAAPMAASADATIYGAIDLAVGFNDIEGAGATVQDNATLDGIDGALGIKGSEDLGNGLSAVYKVEFNFDADDGNEDGAETGAGNALSIDEAWVGIAGNFGVVAMGTEDHPYKNVLNASGYNMFGDRLNDLDSINDNVGAVGFRQETANNAILYITPDFNGFSGQAAIVAAEGAGTAGALTNDGFDAYSLGVNYKGGGLKVGLAYEDIDVATGAGTAAGLGNTQAWVIAGSYTFGDFVVGAAYEEQDDAATRGGGFVLGASDVETFGVSGAYTFGNNKVGLSYVMEEQENAAGAEIADIAGWGATVEHSLSNRTSVYASFRDSENDVARAAGDEETSFNVGLLHSF